MHLNNIDSMLRMATKNHLCRCAHIHALNNIGNLPLRTITRSSMSAQYSSTLLTVTITTAKLCILGAHFILGGCSRFPDAEHMYISAGDAEGSLSSYSGSYWPTHFTVQLLLSGIGSEQSLMSMRPPCAAPPGSLQPGSHDLCGPRNSELP